MIPKHIVSADSHVVEPADLWATRVDKQFRERAPQVRADPESAGLPTLYINGLKMMAISAFGAAGRSGEELKEFEQSAGYEQVHRGAYDPTERIKAQEEDGVEAEVLYTSLGMPLFGLRDTELQHECFRAYNDWLAEYCSHSPKRLIGTALITLADIPAAIAELQRTRKAGLRGAQIWGSTPVQYPTYDNPAYDPFWQAACDLDIPLSLHIGTGGSRSPAMTLVKGLAKLDENSPGLGRVSSYVYLAADIQQSLYVLSATGVLERFPKLRIVSAENDIGWMPHFLYRLDHAWNKYHALGSAKNLSMTPGDFIRRQVWATFQDDPIGPVTYKFYGEDNYMWASDFPHGDCTWPNSRKVIEQDFAGVPNNITDKIVYDNAVKLYQLDLN
ncbi:MAG TPA: amidohydrolase family protein [Candidatus Binataceae bacterium]|jgi:predicted TIM-barrel fold metal-dependent hydrolase|nr:amidohydrolase family protein [Candidatus Binataceae bacterium]